MTFLRLVLSIICLASPAIAEPSNVDETRVGNSPLFFDAQVDRLRFERTLTPSLETSSSSFAAQVDWYETAQGFGQGTFAPYAQQATRSPAAQYERTPELMEQFMAPLGLKKSFDPTDPVQLAKAHLASAAAQELEPQYRSFTEYGFSTKRIGQNYGLNSRDSVDPLIARVLQHSHLPTMRVGDIATTIRFYKDASQDMNDGTGVGTTSPYNPLLGTSLQPTISGIPICLYQSYAPGCAERAANFSVTENSNCGPLQVFYDGKCKTLLKTAKAVMERPCLKWPILTAAECEEMLKLTSIVNWRKVFEKHESSRDSAIVIVHPMRRDYETICTGFKIANGFVVTAAHCCPEENYITFSEYTETGDRRATEIVPIYSVRYANEKKARQLCRPVSRGGNYPPAGSFSGFDIALLSYTPQGRTSEYKPLRIVMPEILQRISSVRLNGYGLNNTSVSGGAEVPDLLMGDSRVKSLDCLVPHPAINKSLHATLVATFPTPCAAGKENLVGMGETADTDVGDSGSPQLALLANGDGVRALVAVSITSRSQDGSKNAGSGSINTRLDVHHDWLVREIRNGSLYAAGFTKHGNLDSIRCESLLDLAAEQLGTTEEYQDRLFELCLKVQPKPFPTLTEEQLSSVLRVRDTIPEWGIK